LHLSLGTTHNFNVQLDEPATPAVANGKDFVGSDDYKVYALNASSPGAESEKPRQMDHRLY